MCGEKGCGEETEDSKCLTFSGVARCILTGVANHPVEVPGSVLQHVIPERNKTHNLLLTIDLLGT